MWYACDCGWRSPNGDDEIEAYAKVMKRYKPVYDGYQGATQSENSLYGLRRRRAKLWRSAGQVSNSMPINTRNRTRTCGGAVDQCRG